MTPSRLFPPPPAWRCPPWLTMLALVAAGLLAALLMTRFVDALHLSMARGEAFRATQSLYGVAEAQTQPSSHLEQPLLARVSR